jgi:hypothetical protein
MTDTRKSRSEPESAPQTEAAEPEPTPAAGNWPAQAQAMETEFMGMMGGRTGTATMERSPFDPEPAAAEPMPEPAAAGEAPPAPPTEQVDTPSRAGAWFRQTWGKLRQKLTFRKAPGPIPNPGPSADEPQPMPIESPLPVTPLPLNPFEVPQVGETSVEGSAPIDSIATPAPIAPSAEAAEPPLVTLSPGRLELSLTYPLVGISVLCLILLCGICFLMGKSTGERSRIARPVTASTSDAGDVKPASPEPPAAKDNGATPAVGRLIQSTPRVERREGAYYLVLASLPDTGWGVKELQRAGKWLKDNYGLETTLETVHTNYRSLVTVDGFTETAGPEVEAAQRLIEACDREYSHLGGCTFKGPYTRRFPWVAPE